MDIYNNLIKKIMKIKEKKISSNIIYYLLVAYRNALFS